MERYLITGAGRGIGRAIARRLAQPKRLLILHGRQAAALEETARQVKASGGECLIVTADLAQPTDIDRLVSAVGDQPLNVLVNNAGVAFVQPVEKITLDMWQQTLAVNVTAPFLLIQKLLPHLTSGSSIVNILSVAAQAAFPLWSSYSMSKAALDGFARSLREELRPRGVRVINIYPAATATGLWDDVPGDWPKDRMLAPEETAEAVAYALGRPPSVQVEAINVGAVGGNL
jgi:NAD(P)-dependent dehydrogenase (short-subunit alcohol dehydrogenase family)